MIWTYLISRLFARPTQLAAEAAMPKLGKLEREILQSVKELRGPVSATEVLAAAGLLPSKKPRQAVSDALARLERKGLVSLESAHRGRRPNRYQVS